MTPQQTLVRLAEIERQLEGMVLEGAVLALIDERRELLAAVMLPPLLTTPEPDAWAHSMAQTVSGLSEETALAWLRAFGRITFGAGFDQGAAAAREATISEMAGQRLELLDALQLVVRLIDTGAVRNTRVRSQDDSDQRVEPLRDVLVRTLRAAGDEVE